jgi:hypothetical protein
MKSSIISGLIAGFLAGIVGFVTSIIWISNLGLVYVVSSNPNPSITDLATIELGHSIIWGIIFGILYSKFYKSIPGTGISKGINFSIIIWLISHIRALLFWSGYGFVFESIIVGFFKILQMIVFGLILGYLYKPTK